MKKFLFTAASLLVALQAAPAVAQVEHYYKTVYDIIQDGDQTCTLFRLYGVNVSHPATGTSYFSVRRAHAIYGELMATLLTARALNLPLRVYATGSASCGHADVVRIDILWQ